MCACVKMKRYEGKTLSNSDNYIWVFQQGQMEREKDTKRAGMNMHLNTHFVTHCTPRNQLWDVSGAKKLVGLWFCSIPLPPPFLCFLSCSSSVSLALWEMQVVKQHRNAAAWLQAERGSKELRKRKVLKDLIRAKLLFSRLSPLLVYVNIFTVEHKTSDLRDRWTGGQ